jgi:hypothetical protein
LLHIGLEAPSSSKLDDGDMLHYEQGDFGQFSYAEEMREATTTALFLDLDDHAKSICDNEAVMGEQVK